MKSKNSNSNLFRLILPFIFSLGILVLLTWALLVIASNLVTKWEYPVVLIQPLSTAAISLSVLVSSLISAKIYQKNGTVTGLILAVFVVACLLGISCVSGSVNFTMLFVYKVLAILVCGLLGGYLGVNCFQKKKSFR